MIFLSKGDASRHLGGARHSQQPTYKQVIKRITKRRIRRDSRRLIEEQLDEKVDAYLTS
jgi:hypothetical protein